MGTKQDWEIGIGIFGFLCILTWYLIPYRRFIDPQGDDWFLRGNSIGQPSAEQLEEWREKD